MLGSASLCLTRQWISRQTLLVGVVCALALMVSSVVIVELVSQRITLFDLQRGFDTQQLGRRVLSALIISAILLRFISLLDLFDQRSKAEAESRVLALQSRIQPHFLFNSLNTISELAATDGEKAEAATMALATVFRASLENERKSHSLAQEITLCRRYLELERFRMQDKLKVNWQISIDQAERWRMPKLMLQPLIENALVHGVQSNGEVEVLVDFRETATHLSLRVENRIGDTISKHSGHGIAIDNIRQRLEALFDDQFTFRSKENDGMYSVLLRFPKQVYAPEVNS